MRLLLSVWFASSLLAVYLVTIQPDPSFKGWTRVPIMPTNFNPELQELKVGEAGTRVRINPANLNPELQGLKFGEPSTRLPIKTANLNPELQRLKVGEAGDLEKLNASAA